MLAGLSIRFEVDEDILMTESRRHLLFYLFLKCFCNDHCCSAFLHQFLAGKNVQLAGDIAGCCCLLTSLLIGYFHT